MLYPELGWMTPVTVRMKDGTSQVFASVNDALDGWRPPQQARRAFVEAARRAGLLRSG